MRLPSRTTWNPTGATHEGDGITITVEELALLRDEASQLAPQVPDVVAGLFPGIYRSLSHGRGLEFEEVRHYLPGDDYRSIDWRVTARSGHLYTKVFREERERTVLLGLDTAATMRFGTRRAFLWVAAAQVLGLIAWLAADNQDRVGGIVLGGQSGIQESAPMLGNSGPLRLFRLWEAAGEQPAGDDAEDLVAGLLRLRHHASHGALIVLASDFRGWNEEAQRHAASMAIRNDVVLVRVTDPLERGIPDAGWMGFSDGQEIRALNTADRGLRESVRQDFEQRGERLRDFCTNHGIRFLQLDAELDPRDGLVQALRDHQVTFSVPV